ncbi:MAG: hypothetical protein Q9182_000115 [Xanthomendoza sp. 2 TL-2023]
MTTPTSYCLALRDRLKTDLQRIYTKIIDSLQASPQLPHCSCTQHGNCRIILVTVTNDDGTTCLKPSFINCGCTPVWHAHHQRQLDLVNAHVHDLQEQMVQLTALEEGIEKLLIHHREFSKAEIRHGQWWLRQDYARTNEAWRLKNIEVYYKQEERERKGWLIRAERETKVEGDETVQGDEWGLFLVDKEDLYLDDEVYEFPLCGFENGGHGAPKVKDDFSTQEEKKEISGGLKATFDDLRQGRCLTLEEVFDRFEDLRFRAATLKVQWEDEDAARRSKIDAIYPLLDRDSCVCTAEQKLYHKCLNFGSPQVHADLEAEVFRSDVWLGQQQAVTADRGSEIQELLRSFDGHLKGQNSELSAALGGEGIRKALVKYLRRYDQQINLPIQEEDSYPSETLTLDLVRKADDMLQRWAVEDASRSVRFADICRKD